MNREIRTRFGWEPDNFACVGPSKTKQADAGETDVNLIVSRYLQTGDASLLNKTAGYFADVATVGDYLECQNTIKEAEMAFADLPAEVRDAFGNNPVALLEAVHDPARRGELEKLGLVEPSTPTASNAPSGAASGSTPAEAAKGSSDPKEPALTTAPS